jgi:hypothetical protein
MNAFAAAMDALFLDPHLAQDAAWRAGGTGPSVTVRIVLRQPDRIGGFGETRLLADTTVVELRTVEVPVVAAGDTIEIDGDLYRVQGEPVRDSERLIWTAELRPA